MSAVLHLFPAPQGVVASSTVDAGRRQSTVVTSREVACSLVDQAIDVRPALMFWLLMPAALVLAVAGLWLDLWWLPVLALAPGLWLLLAWHRAVSAMRGLRLKVSVPSPCFAGDTGMVELRIFNGDRRDCADIAFSWAYRADDPSGWLDVPSRSCVLGLLPLPTRERGPLALPPLCVESQAPLSVFRARVRWQPALQLMVCPRPDLSPCDQSTPRSDAWLRRHGAVGAPWLTLADELTADVDLTADVPQRRERALSTLTAQVLRAEIQGRPYGLRLGGLVVPPGRGLLHRRRCLELLAHWRLPPQR